MPVLAAVLSVLVWPLTGAVLLAAVVTASGWDSPSADLVLGSAAAVLCLAGLGCAVRAARARVVLTGDQLRVHNVLATIRIGWAEVEAVDEVSFLNVWALRKPLWYGTAVRVRRRRRPVGVLASWHPDPDAAAALRQQIRPPASEPRRTPPDRP